MAVPSLSLVSQFLVTKVSMCVAVEAVTTVSLLASLVGVEEPLWLSSLLAVAKYCERGLRISVMTCTLQDLPSRARRLVGGRLPTSV